MKAIIAVVILALVVGILLFVPTLAAPYQESYGPVTISSCATALGVCAMAALVAGVVISRSQQSGPYLVKLFMWALIVRVIVGTTIFVFNAQDFFGGDAWTYDFTGWLQARAWGGDKFAGTLLLQFQQTGSLVFFSASGMIYMVGAIYAIVGRNMMAIQFFNAVLGAATAPIIYLCAHEAFKNRRVASIAGVAVG